MSVNQFIGTTYISQGVAVFERDQMSIGNPDARIVFFDLETRDPYLAGMLPSDLDGPPPPAGSPNTFVEVDSPDTYPTTRTMLQLFQFSVNWMDPASSTFTGPLILDTDPFNANLCAYDNCVPQPGTSQLLDPLSDRLM